MSKKNSKQGSTLLFTMLVFSMFLIFAAALTSLAQRSFQQTASDVDYQRAYFTAKSTAEVFVKQLEGNTFDAMLTQVVEDGQTLTGDWVDFDEYSQYRYTLKRDSTNDLPTSSITTLLVTAEGRVNGKIQSVTAEIQATTRFNEFYDPERVVMINQCKIPTEATANFWINASSTKIKPAVKPTTPVRSEVTDPLKKEETKVEEPKGNDLIIDEEDDPNDKVTLIYRNIEEPKITGNLDANIYLEPAEFTKAILGTTTANEVEINGTVYCRGNLVIRNTIINGDVHVDGKITFEGESRVNGTAYTNKPVDAGKVNSFQPLNAGVFVYYDKIEPLITEKLALDRNFITVHTLLESDVTIKTASDVDAAYELTNENVSNLRIEVDDKTTSTARGAKVAIVYVKKLPAKIEIVSKIQNFQLYLYVEDPAPVLADQISSNLVAPENIHLLFANPVTITGNTNASIYSDKIIFGANGLQLSGSVQACEFENASLLTSFNLQKKYYDTAFIPKLDGNQKYYYFDFLAYRN